MKRIKNPGRTYRFGQRLKDFGERLCYRKITALFGRPLVRLGLRLMDSVMDCPAGEFK